LSEVIQILKQNLPALKERYPLQSLGVFDSYSRNEEHADSDLDIVYETLPDTFLSLHKFLNLQKDLQQITNLEIDLVNKKHMSEAIWLTAQKDIVYV